MTIVFGTAVGLQLVGILILGINLFTMDVYGINCIQCAGIWIFGYILRKAYTGLYVCYNHLY